MHVGNMSNDRLTADIRHALETYDVCPVHISKDVLTAVLARLTSSANHVSLLRAVRLLAADGDRPRHVIAEISDDAWRVELERRGWTFSATFLLPFHDGQWPCEEWNHVNAEDPVWLLDAGHPYRGDRLVEALDVIAATAIPREGPAEVLASMLAVDTDDDKEKPEWTSATAAH